MTITTTEPDRILYPTDMSIRQDTLIESSKDIVPT